MVIAEISPHMHGALMTPVGMFSDRVLRAIVGGAAEEALRLFQQVK